MPPGKTSRTAGAQTRPARTAALVALSVTPRTCHEAVRPQTATAVITCGQAEGDAEPWTRAAFVEKVVALQRRRQLRSASGDVTLQCYDRSPVCTHALSTYLGRPVPETLSGSR